MKNLFFFLLIFMASNSISSSLMGQSIEELVKNREDGAYQKKITVERKPAVLPGVREADVIWSKIVWRLVDLREKANQHFYFPLTEYQGRSNMFNLLLKGIKNNTIIAFAANDPNNPNNEFAKPISYDEIEKLFDAGKTTKIVKNPDNGQEETVTIIKEIGLDEVKELLIKEIWYFDKQKSSLQVRILGICPTRVYTKAGVETKSKLFWVSYPEIRPLLAKSECLNARNGARNFSFDDLFLMRNFDGYIVKEENVYDNREILAYATGEYASQESERIKTAIFNFEQDLWEY
jgi:gliding motility associated protien GldN